LCTAVLAKGTGTCSPGSATALAAGGYGVTAGYQGNAAFTGSTSAPAALTVRKEPTKSVLALSAATIRYGLERSLIITVTISPRYAGTPTGTITIKAGKITICSGQALSKGRVTCSPGSGTTLPAGRWSLVASYSGSGSSAASASSARTLNVKP
jgi:hypothetical protein